MRLILRVRKNNVKNIYQLAKELGRRYEAVYRDLKYLEGMGIIKLKKKQTIPFMDEQIIMPVIKAE